jgi:hypothetical protein
MGNIYSRAEAVIIMVGGVVAAQELDRSSAWINRAWTFQEATLCGNNTWVLLKWCLPGSFESSNISIRRIDDGRGDHHLALVSLDKLLHHPPGKGLGIGYLTHGERKCEVELKFPFRCFGDDAVAIDALAACMKRIIVKSEFDSTEYGDDDFEGYDQFGSKAYANKEAGDPLRSWEDSAAVRRNDGDEGAEADNWGKQRSIESSPSAGEDGETLNLASREQYRR